MSTATSITPNATAANANLRRTPTLPSPQQVEKWLQERMPGLRLYNPSDRWIQLEVHGRTDLWAPPDLGGAGEEHPALVERDAAGEIIGPLVVSCTGELEVRGRNLSQKDSSGKVISGQDAASVVKYLIGKEQYGQMGLVWLPGISAEEDEGLKQAARNAWVEYQKQEDEAIIARRAEFKTNWEKNPAHRGDPCPPPTESETAAIERQQERRHAVHFRFACDAENCPGFAVNDWERFRRHMKVAHRVDVKKEMYEGEIGAFAGKPSKTTSTPAPTTSIAQAASRQAGEELSRRRREPEITQPAGGDEDEDDDGPSPTPTPAARTRQRK